MKQMAIKTKEANPFKLQKKTKLVEALADLDNEILERLVALKNSPKAMQMISTKEGWQTIAGFVL